MSGGQFFAGSQVNGANVVVSPLQLVVLCALAVVAVRPTEAASPVDRSDERVLRAVWLDDIAPQGAISLPNNACYRGRVARFPQRWATVADPANDSIEVRFQLTADGVVFGTIGDITDWTTTPSAPLPGHPYLYAARWMPSVGDTVRPWASRFIFPPESSSRPWTVLADANDDGWGCGALGASAATAEGQPTVDPQQYSAAAWSGLFGSVMAHALDGPIGSVTSAVGPGSAPTVGGIIWEECGVGQLGASLVPRAGIAAMTPRGWFGAEPVTIARKFMRTKRSPSQRCLRHHAGAESSPW